MRIVFAGSPAIAVPALEAVSAAPYLTLAAVLTNPDAPRGRSASPAPSAVAAAAERLAAASVPILKPARLNAEARAELALLRPELLVSFAYGHIFGPKFLALFPRGGLNIHPSLLPRHRGAAPIQAAILQQDRETGLSIQTLAAEMDAGDLLYQERFPLGGRETTESLSALMAEKAAAALPGLLNALAQGRAQSRPQAGDPSRCSPIRKDQGRIDWTLSAAALDAQIRAFTPWPLSWTMHGNRILLLLEAAPLPNPPASSQAPGTVLGADHKAGILVQTGNGVLGITRLQYQTRKALDWRAFLNGAGAVLQARFHEETL